IVTDRAATRAVPAPRSAKQKPGTDSAFRDAERGVCPRCLDRLQVLDEVALFRFRESEAEVAVVVVDDRAVVREAAVVIEAAFRAHEESRERRGAVAIVGRARRLEVVDADLGGGVHRPARLAEERRNVARGATPAALEDRLAARG